MLPEEIYVELHFDDHDRAVAWCDSLVSDLQRRVFDFGPWDRVVLWRPSLDQSKVYLSVLAMRIVRALGNRYLPVTGLVSLAQFPPGFQLMLGNQSDQQAYREVKF
jgi:hypothetical protein